MRIQQAYKLTFNLPPHPTASSSPAGWFDPSSAFAAQAAMNAPGKSPPFCSEF
jgi:hypothetical protein